MWETWVRSLGWEDPLEKGKATHSSILAWRIPWTIQSMGSQRVGNNRDTFTFHREYHEKHYKPTLLTSIVMLKSYKLEKIFERAFTHLTICVNTLTILCPHDSLDPRQTFQSYNCSKLRPVFKTSESQIIFIKNFWEKSHYNLIITRPKLKQFAIYLFIYTLG